jgi:hypothetical protein
LAHDLNLLQIADFIGLKEEYSFIDYASTILMEFHSIEDEPDCVEEECFEIRILMNGR